MTPALRRSLPGLACAALLAGCAPSRPVPVDFPSEARRADLSAIRVSHDLAGETRVARADGTWLVLPDSIPADTARLREALDKIFALHAAETVAEAGDDPDALVPYGLDPGSAVSVRLEFGPGRIVALNLGRAPGDFTDTYWLQEGRRAVHRVRGSAAHAVPVERAAWMSYKVFPDFVGERDIAELRVEWTDSSGARAFYRLARVEVDSLVLLEPPPVRGVPRRKSVELLGRARQISADAVPDASEPSPAAGDRPVAVRILTRNGEMHALRTSGEDETHYHARHPAGGRIKLLKWRLRDLAVSPEDLTAPVPFGPEPDDGLDYGPPPPDFGVLMPHYHDVSEDELEDGHDHDHEHEHDHKDH